MKAANNQLKLVIKGEDAETYIKTHLKNVVVIEGDVTFIHKFGDSVGEAEIESRELKQMKADIYVACNSYYILQMLRYIKTYGAITRRSTSNVGLLLG